MSNIGHKNTANSEKQEPKKSGKFRESCMVERDEINMDIETFKHV